ncbi:MAG: agmatine deiminase family protein [Hyphomicrobiaceae bacterium]
MAKSGRGFHLPEESKLHARTFMQWPVNQQIHPDNAFLDVLQDSVAEVANTISEFEPVVMLMDPKYQKSSQRKLGRKIEVLDIPTDDLWCRDAGPLFITNAKGEIAVAHFKFNGWGNKQSHVNDGQIARRVAKRLGIPLIDSGLVGEAGGVETDGDGTLIAHESCWVNTNRNTEDRSTIEKRLKSALGVTKMIWAPGIKGADITDYHIDALARFVRPGVVVIQLPDKPDKSDPWSIAAFETLKILRNATDAKKRPLEILTLPEPHNTRVTTPDFVASYVNYYVCNGAVIAAQFGDRKADAEAKATLKRLYPEREVIMLDVDPIGETGGGIHCATQQQPMV